MPSKLKAGGIEFLRAGGLFELSKLFYRSKIRILAYHRFGEGYVAAKIFESQIKYLKKHFNIIDLGSYLDFLYWQKELPSNSVIITIDDGYQDFYVVAFQILRNYEVPATVYLTADFIDKGIWLWHDLLNFGLKNTVLNKFTLNGRSFDLTNISGKSRLKLYLDQVCTSVAPIERDELINQVLEELRVKVPERPTPEYAPLTWNQILEMSKHGISFGSHTCSHPILSKLPTQDALYEIKESKKRLEDFMQREILSFCYPNGKEGDFNEHIKLLVKEAGFAGAMSLIYGMNDLKSDPYELRRMALDGRFYIHFLHDVSGFGELRNSLRRKALR
jgi:peptidoglycan/xylan/chitin deacetylase (PgdA/CDA1 family)